MNPFILPHNKTIFFEVLHIIHGAVGFEFEHKPTHVRPEKTLGNIIGVIVGIDMFMVSSMFRTPPHRRIFKSGSTEEKDK